MRGPPTTRAGLLPSVKAEMGHRRSRYRGLLLIPQKQLNRSSTVEPLREHDAPPIDFAIEPASAWERSYRHEQFARTRYQAYKALLATGTNSSRLERFAECGARCSLTYSHTRGEYRVQASHCKDRWCDACSRDRGMLVSSNLAEWLRRQPARFITLTLKHNSTPLTKQIARLRACYQELRRTKLWKQAVRGTVSVIEIQLSKADLWHPHLHILAVGNFIPQHDLAAAWHGITGDSWIVDVRAVKDPTTAAGYVAKYVAKPISSRIYDHPDKLQEAVVSLRGLHAWSCTGTCRGLKLGDVPDDGLPDDWQTLGRLEDIVQAAARGEVEDKSLLQFLESKGLWKPPRSPP